MSQDKIGAFAKAVASGAKVYAGPETAKTSPIAVEVNKYVPEGHLYAIEPPPVMVEWIVPSPPRRPYWVGWGY